MKNKFKHYLKENSYSSKTITSCMNMISIYMDWLKKENLNVTDITYTDLLLYMKHCQRKGRSQRTIQHYIGVVRHLYNYLVKERVITINPTADIEVKGVKRRAVYRIYEPHELNEIYNNYKCETLAEKRNKVMFGLMIYQGLKTEELAKLEVHNIKLKEGKIEVPASRRSNYRKMNLESHQVMEMYDYVHNGRIALLQTPPEGKAKADPETEKLFIGSGGTSSSFSNYVAQLMKIVRAQCPGLQNAKHIRACVIVKWLKTHNLREVQVMAGHKYISTTEGYQQNDIEGLKEEVNQYHPL